MTAAEYGRARESPSSTAAARMFGPTADLGHKAMRIVFTLSGNVPKEV